MKSLNTGDLGIRQKYVALLAISFLGFFACGQYKNMSVGVRFSTEKFTKSYFSSAVDVQYNTQNTFSFRSGISVDITNHQENTDYKIYNYDVGQYQTFIRTDDINNWHFNIPLLAQASFGEKFHFTLVGGFLISGLLKNPYVKTEVHWFYPNEGKLESTSEGTVKVGGKSECNLYYGAAISFPMGKQLLLSIEGAALERLDDDNSSYSYNVYDGFRLSLGINYQFNLRNKSDYHFTNYSLKIKKVTNGI